MTAICLFYIPSLKIVELNFLPVIFRQKGDCYSNREQVMFKSFLFELVRYTNDGDEFSKQSFSSSWSERYLIKSALDKQKQV